MHEFLSPKLLGSREIGMKSDSVERNQSIANGLAIALLSTALGFVPSLPAQADILTLPDGWRCEGQFSGQNGRGICVPYAEINAGDPYKYYRGDIRNGTFNGYGLIVYENDDRYEGQIVNGRPNGKGMFYAASENRRYEGDFRNGEFHGQGKYTFADGGRYTGQFAGGQPHGRGVFVAVQDGQYAFTYSGQFYYGVINGNGSLTLAGGGRCQGTFYSNTLTGKGTCTYPAGNTFRSYTGELRNGLPDGRGTAIYADGRRYTGEFREGKAGLSASRQ